MRLILLASSIVAVLAAPTIAQAATCPTDAPVTVLEAPGFACTMADKTFADFALMNVPTSAMVSFGQLGPLFAVTLSRDGVFFPVGTTKFDYTVSAAAPLTILQATVGVDVSFPPEVTVTTMNGQTVSIANGGTGQILFSPGAGVVSVDNTSHILTGTTELNSVSNDFSQVVVGIPEPGSLPLAVFALGGLALFLWQRER